jgi:DNA-binding response OmpR family regulator
VVDDDRSLATAIRRGLVGKGFAVDVAFDGTDALWYATENTYDAIVLDIMPRSRRQRASTTGC